MSKKLINGLLWSVIEVLIKRILDLVVRLVLARLLFPEDFGIVGMATVFHSFILVVNEAGLGMALIQRKEEDLTEAHYHTVFWSNLALSALLFLAIVFFIGPAAASFYNEPVLRQVIPVLGISLLFSALNTVHKAQLMKAMQLKKMAFVNNVSAVIAGVCAIIMAFCGFGIWALVLYNVLTFFISVPLFFRTTRWLPKFVWQKKAFNDVFGFGVYTTGTKIINNVSSNIDYLIIGKLLAAGSLGAYTLAFMLTNMVKAQIESMLNRVLFPFYSSLQNDIEKIKVYYLKIIKYYAAVIYPIMSFLILLGGPIIYLFFGNKWDEAVEPAKILAWSVVINVICSGYNLLFRSIGKPKSEMNIQLFTVVFFYIPFIIVGCYQYGIVGAAYGILISTILRVVFIQFLLYKFFSITPKDILSVLKDPMLAFGFTYVFGYLFIYFSPLNEYVSLAFVLLLNIIFAVIFMKKDLRSFLALLKKPKSKIAV